MNDSFFQESLSSAETTEGFTPGNQNQVESQPLSELRVMTGSSSSATIGASALSLSSLNGAPPSTPVRAPSSVTPQSEKSHAFPPALKSQVTVDDILKKKPRIRNLEITPEVIAGFQEVLKAFQHQDYFHTLEKMNQGTK